MKLHTPDQASEAQIIDLVENGRAIEACTLLGLKVHDEASALLALAGYANAKERDGIEVVVDEVADEDAVTGTLDTPELDYSRVAA